MTEAYYSDNEIKRAVERTVILRPPQQTLATFGITKIRYYMLTEPVSFNELEEREETVIREGAVIAQRPRVVTPYYLSQMEGFSPNAKRYHDTLIKKLGREVPGILYSYRNESQRLNIVAGGLPSVAEQIKKDIDEKKDTLATIIRGEDDLWDVSLFKFIYELTAHSLQNNLEQLGSRGLLKVGADGVPADTRMMIEELFKAVVEGESEPQQLKEELERWNLFEEYQDRFFKLFKKR
jgi:hypothetical protein